MLARNTDISLISELTKFSDDEVSELEKTSAPSSQKLQRKMYGIIKSYHTETICMAV